MSIDLGQIQATTQRYGKRTAHRNRNERLIREGRYLEADSSQRVEKFLKREGFSPSEAHELMLGAREGIRTRVPGRAPNALERVLGTNELMGVAFLETGLSVSRTVGRVWIGVSGGMASGYGTGFLVSPRLLMTNHHVLGDKATARSSLVEFNYQIGIDGKFLTTAAFSFDPDTFFFADQHLDYAIVAVQANGPNGRNLAEFGWNPLIEEEGKAIVSQWLNIIQHPNGEVKQLALRENQLVDVLEEFLQYKTDTAPGSSGSPVFNDRWEVVGLHHSGVWATNSAGQILAIDGRVWDQSMGEHRIRWIANEGVRISRILAHLRQQSMDAAQRRLFDEISTTQPSSQAPVREQARPVAPEPSRAQVAVASDGTATWTIPLSVSIRLGGEATPILSDQFVRPVSATPVSVSPPLLSPATALPNDSESILEAARREFGERADVLRVRLGYVFRDGWITDERAIVVTVRQKKPLAALREAAISPLPDYFGGMPVEVTGPTLAEAVAMARGPAAATEIFARSEVLREEIVYTPPAGTPLNQVTDTMRVIAHVSPDAGWSQLSAFLGAIRRQLTVGMYDFGAPHILEVVQRATSTSAFRKMTLVMQRGESLGGSTKEDDLTDDEVVNRLSEQLGNRFENAWVRIGPVQGWVARSYHIKVAVRDQRAFWLSSGNWQSSNQPQADPLVENPPRRFWLDRYNREWHAIVEHPGLAKTFEAFLLHDFRNNRAESDESLIPELPELLVSDSLFLAEEAAPAPRYFPPFDENRNFTVRPLLTPDNYHEHVLAMVRGAREEILFQNQTFNAPSSQGKLKELVSAIRQRQQAGVRVRIIFRLINPADARENLEALKDFGFPSASIKVQGNCHTKGIIVDRQRVLLGSQNWSETGVSTNRDASLLFEDEPLARYFAEIFEYDWQSLARTNIGNESVAVEAALTNEPTPPGMKRLNAKDYMELL